MKTLKHASLVALSLALFPACAKKKEDPKPQPVVALPSVEGSWVSDCQLDTTTNVHYKIELAYGADGRLIETIDNYNLADQTCAGSVQYSTLVQSNYKVEGLASAGTLNVQTQMTEIDLIPRNDAIVTDWNRGRGHCDITSWKLGQPLSVDAACVQNHDADDVDRLTIYSIVKIDGDMIERGHRATRDQDGHSAEHRFTAPDETLKFIKKGSQADLTAQCPAFAAAYMCDISGDEDFNGRDLGVAKTGGEYRLEAKKANQVSNLFVYVVDGKAHAMPATPGVTGSMSASCANGDLNARMTVTKNDSAAVFTQDRRFRIVKNGANLDVVIDTTETTKQTPNDNGTIVNRRIECRPL